MQLLQSVSLDFEIFLVIVGPLNKFEWTVWLLTNEIFLFKQVLLNAKFQLDQWLGKVISYGAKISISLWFSDAIWYPGKITVHDGELHYLLSMVFIEP